MSLATSPIYLNLKIRGPFNWKDLLEYLQAISSGNVEDPKAYAQSIDVGDTYHSVFSPTEKMHYLIYKEGESWNNFVKELKRRNITSLTEFGFIGKSTKTRKSVRKTKKSVRKTRKSPKTKKSVRKSPRKTKKSARKTRQLRK